MSPERAEVLSWLSKADNDRRAAQLALQASPPITDVAGFHLQQAAEKLLKAFLVARRVSFEKIHDLSELIEQCIEVEAEFTSLRHEVAALTPFAVRYRYPGPVDPTVDQIKFALAIVDRLTELVLLRFNAI